jgi:hypothetical protein
MTNAYIPAINVVAYKTCPLALPSGVYRHTQYVIMLYFMSYFQENTADSAKDDAV